MLGRCAHTRPHATFVVLDMHMHGAAAKSQRFEQGPLRCGQHLSLPGHQQLFFIAPARHQAHGFQHVPGSGQLGAQCLWALCMFALDALASAQADQACCIEDFLKGLLVLGVPMAKVFAVEQPWNKLSGQRTGVVSPAVDEGLKLNWQCV